MTEDDRADLALLLTANEKGKFAIELGYRPPSVQFAFERGIDGNWFRFVDLSGVATPAAGGKLMRVFKLTAEGEERLRELRAMQQEDDR